MGIIIKPNIIKNITKMLIHYDQSLGYFKVK